MVKEFAFAVTLLTLLITAPISNAEVNCDKVAAQRVFDMLGAMASRYVKGEVLIYQWNGDWNAWDENQRLQMITAAANADACLTGKARKIEFYSPLGVLVGKASPYTGIQRVK